MKSPVLILIFILLACFSSCSKEDSSATKEKEINFSLSNDLVGFWYINEPSKEKSYSKNVKQSNSKCIIYSILFKEDGTFIIDSYQGEISGNYTVTGEDKIELGAGSVTGVSIANNVLNFVLLLDNSCSAEGTAELTAYIPDDAFEAELIDLGLDSILDNYISINAIDTVQGFAYSPFYQDFEDKPLISDLTGIEHFENLKTLWVEQNLIQEINLSKNEKLELLGLSGNPLAQIDLTHNKNLKKLYLGSRSIVDLDLSENRNLQELNLKSLENLKKLDLSNNSKLERLNLNWLTGLTKLQTGDNLSLKSIGIIEIGSLMVDFSLLPNLEKISLSRVGSSALLDFQNNLKLKELHISNSYDSGVENIDLSHNPNLELLYLSDIPLTLLNLDNFENLRSLTIFKTMLGTVNFSGNNNLISIRITHNPYMESLDVSSISNLSSVALTENLNLMCVRVNQEQLNVFPNWEKEQSTSFSLECPVN